MTPYYTEKEICSIWRRSEQNIEALEILFQLTLTAKKDLKKLLEKNGYDLSNIPLQYTKYLRQWTKEDREKFQVLYHNEHYTDEEIANELNTFESAVKIYRYSVCGLERWAITPKGDRVNFSWIPELIKEGKTTPEIAELFCVYPAYIRAWLNRKGIYNPNLERVRKLKEKK